MTRQFIRCHNVYEVSAGAAYTWFTRWMQNSVRRPPTIGPSPRTWATGPPLGSYETTSTIAIIITQFKSGLKTWLFVQAYSRRHHWELCLSGTLQMLDLIDWSIDIWLCSYSDTEQYEEAVRDYEKVCKMDKSRGTLTVTFSLTVLTTTMNFSLFSLFTFSFV